MIQELQYNPYRFLGVYANSPAKERLANFNRMKAFLKVGKSISFPLDLSQYISPLPRIDSEISDAAAKLSLPRDQILYAQLWFIKITPLDDIAFNHLIAGEMTKAQEIWQTKECASSLQNRIVCALINKDYSLALSLAETLYGNAQYIDQFVSAVIGVNGNVDTTDLCLSFLDILCNEVGAATLLPYTTNSVWKAHISREAVEPLINSIQKAIDAAKKSKGKDPSERLDAGETLKRTTRDTLEQLKSFLSPTDPQYQVIADKLGIEILQCGIDYYNRATEPDAPLKAMELQNYALSIVTGPMAKDRCKKNVDILQKVINDLPPTEVFAEDRAIHEELRKYRLLPDKICHAITLLNNTRPYLLTIKNKLGKSNEYYLKISTRIVKNALSNVIAEVNEAQSQRVPGYGLRGNLYEDEHHAAMTALVKISIIKSVLEKAWEATLIMDTFDMLTEYKSGSYNKNRSILKDLCSQLDVSTSVTRETQREATRPIMTTNSKTTDSHTSQSSDSKIGIGCLVTSIMLLLGCLIWGIIAAVKGDSPIGLYILGALIVFLIKTKIEDSEI